MENKAVSIARRLRLTLLLIYVVAACTATVFEIGLFQNGTVTKVSTVYLLQVIGVFLSLGLIPLSLKGFKSAVQRVTEKPDECKVKFYMTVAWIRLAAFFLVIEYGVLLNYLINDTIGLYCAVIGVICSLFCFPSVAQVESELGSEENNP